MFMEAMVSWLINGEKISYVWKPCRALHFTVLWARLGRGNVCPSFVRNPMISLCYIRASLCFAIHQMDHIEVIASCMIFRESMCLLKSRSLTIVLAWRCMSLTQRIVRGCMVYKSILGVGMQHRLRSSHILLQGLVSIAISPLLCPTLSLFVPFSMTFMYCWPQVPPSSTLPSF